MPLKSRRQTPHGMPRLEDPTTTHRRFVVIVGYNFPSPAKALNEVQTKKTNQLDYRDLQKCTAQP